MKKIILFQFDSKREKSFNQCLSQLQESYETIGLDKIDDLKDLDFKVHSLFYLFGKDQARFEEFMQFMQNTHPNIPITVIFKKRDFDVLLRAFDYPLINVLDRRFSPGQIQKCLLMSELNLVQRKTSELPIEKITALFSSPIKIKNNETMAQILSTYFSEFDHPIEFALVNIGSCTMSHVFGNNFYPEKIDQKLRNANLAKFYIGHNEELSEDIFATPIYDKEDSITWLVYRLGKDYKNLVFNKYFYRFIENALIYRKGIDKTENYRDLAEKDDVTGLFNQRKLAQDLHHAIEEHESTNQNFSIMFIDVDHFKKVNDNFGHVIGSKMLIGIGEILSNELRGSDKIYRYGGDEFVVIMPKVDIDIVHKVALRVQNKMKEKIFNIDEAKDYKLSVSIGIAQYPTDAKSADEIINFADEMMYVSKKSGRGKIFHVGEITDDAISS